MVSDAEVHPAVGREDAAVPSRALQRLLDAAKAAGPHERISYRDPIASHGAVAIALVTPWLEDRALAAFAVRVVLRAGMDGDREEAIRLLQKSRTKVPPIVREDVKLAIRQLEQLIPDAPWHSSGQTARTAGSPDLRHPRPRRVAATKVPVRRPRDPEDLP